VVYSGIYGEHRFLTSALATCLQLELTDMEMLQNVWLEFLERHLPFVKKPFGVFEPEITGEGSESTAAEFRCRHFV